MKLQQYVLGCLLNAALVSIVIAEEPVTDKNSVAAEQPSSQKAITTGGWKATLGDLLCFLITKGDDTSEVTEQLGEVATQVIPDQKLSRVRYFNEFGELIFGRQATIALPKLNYLIVNEKGLSTLSHHAKKFALGRSLLSLKQGLSGLLHSHILAPVSLGYSARRFNRKLDEQTATELNAAQGGVEYFEECKKLMHDGTIVSSIARWIPFRTLFLYCLSFVLFADEKSNGKMRLAFLLPYAFLCAPGSAINSGDKVTNGLFDMRPFKWIATQPALKDRILAMAKIAVEQGKIAQS